VHRVGMVTKHIRRAGLVLAVSLVVLIVASPAALGQLKKGSRFQKGPTCKGPYNHSHSKNCQ